MSKVLLVSLAALLTVATPSAFQAANPSVPQTSKIDSRVGDGLRKGEDALAAKKFRAALDAFKQAHQRAKNLSVPALWGMVRAYHGLAEHKNEADTCLAALKLVVGDRAMEADLRYHRGVALYLLAMQPGDRALREAEVEFSTAMSLPNAGPLTHFYLGMTILRQGSRDAEGLQHLESALAGGLKPPELNLASRAIENPRRAGELFAPEFSLVTRTGVSITNKDLMGKTVLLDFWGTWCPPCVKSTPGLVKLYEKFAGPSFEMIGISSDKPKDKAKWETYIDQHQLRWPQYLELKGTVIPPFNVGAYPTFIIIDSEGMVRLRLSGYGPGTMEKLEAAIQRTMDGGR
jgi:thiol-disulfide isomerase/thioredoxin